MTNFEKYRAQILEFAGNNSGSNPAVVGSKIINCRDVRCSECEFSKKKKKYVGLDCFSKLLLWLYEEEYREEPSVDWSKVETDTKVLVSDDGEEWHKRHFAKYEEGIVYVWAYGDTSWTTDLMEAWECAKLAEEDAE